MPAMSVNKTKEGGLRELKLAVNIHGGITRKQQKSDGGERVQPPRCLYLKFVP